MKYKKIIKPNFYQTKKGQIGIIYTIDFAFDYERKQKNYIKF